MHEGWIGTKEALLYALDIVGAKRVDGGFLVDGSIVSSPDGAEVVVGADAVYWCGWERKSLAGLMRGTSQGVAVKVF